MHPKNPKLQADNSDDSQRRVVIPARDQTNGSITAPQRDAAAQIARHHISQAYDKNPPHQLKEESLTQQDNSNPYKRTHGDGMQATDKSGAWNHYHNSWQNYYQEYYKRYYLHQLHQQKQTITASPAQSVHQPHQPDTFKPAPDEEPSTQTEAATQLRSELLGKIKHQAGNVRRSTHFLPIVSALVVGLLFLFVQYNRLFVANVKAYVSPGSSISQNIIVDPTTSTKVGPEPRVVVPKINVDAPVVYGVGSLQEDPIQDALRSGVVHYPIPGANSVPGQVGNTVLLGHSSNDVFDNGQYKFVFLLLERLNEGDTFYIHYNGTRYTYSVTKKEVIDPTEVGKLVINTGKPMATLVTCVPPGTALKRLVVYADQISPDPTAASAAPQQAQNTEPATIPDYNAKSFFERLFGQ